jgi:ABC-2 type transport system ATP-binding protein
MDSTLNAVEVRDLVVTRGDHTAVDSTTWSAPTGSITVVLGPNGAGKTTTVEHLEGYLPRRSGTSTVLGLDPSTNHPALTARVGIMLQDGGIQPAIRPIELLSQYASFFTDPESPDDLLERVGLAERRRSAYRSLSGGEKQRLSLALALVGKPELLFLDEPTAGVDLSGRDLIRSLIRNLAESRRTVVLTTHDIAEAEQLADHVVILHRGRVAAMGSPAELTSGEGDNLGFSAQPGLASEELANHLSAPVSETSPGRYVVEAPPDPHLVSAVATWLAEHSQNVGDIRARTRSLEDVFREVTGDFPGSGTVLDSGRDGDT